MDSFPTNNSLIQWPNFKLSGITCLAGKYSLNFYLRVHWLSETKEGFYSLSWSLTQYQHLVSNFQCVRGLCPLKKKVILGILPRTSTNSVRLFHEKIFGEKDLPSLKITFWHLKIGGWFRYDPFLFGGFCLFWGARNGFVLRKFFIPKPWGILTWSKSHTYLGSPNLYVLLGSINSHYFQ